VQHLTYLKYIDFVFGAFVILSGVLAILGGLGMGAMMILLAGDIIMGVIYLVVFLVMGVVVLGVGGLMVMTGRGLEQGRGRIVQTIISGLMVINPASFPIGTAIGAYGLWVCWMNAESKAAFEGGV
jgi:hypothetical protein